MSNKTIIDGIDVSKCIDFIYPIGCNSKNTKSIECKKNSNCYFKQLARAKEQIAFLQNTINHFAEKFISKVENSERMTVKELELASCKQELEEIKKEFQIEYLQDHTTGKRTYRSLTLINIIGEKEKQLSRHEQAFVILEDICRNLLDDEYTRNIATCLLDIINKVKEK